LALFSGNAAQPDSDKESKTEELAKETQNPVANLGYYADSCNIPLTKYCRVVLGQRRGARRLEDILKVVAATAA